jgi:hypothetical protein
VARPADAQQQLAINEQPTWNTVMKASTATTMISPTSHRRCGHTSMSTASTSSMLTVGSFGVARRAGLTPLASFFVPLPSGTQ